VVYPSGEEIHPGDRVTSGSNADTIELVVEGLTGDPETDWLFENHGAGVEETWDHPVTAHTLSNKRLFPARFAVSYRSRIRARYSRRARGPTRVSPMSWSFHG
jgi:hypothetical protein